MKKGKLREGVVIRGNGELCPKCKIPMQRRYRSFLTDRIRRKGCYFSEWDYCPNCSHVQHYEQFKCLIGDMAELERQESFLKDLTSLF